jgi:hypothetical protein
MYELRAAGRLEAARRHSHFTFMTSSDVANQRKTVQMAGVNVK